MSDPTAGLRLVPVAGVAEVLLWQAPESVGLFDLTDGYDSERPPPFWSFAWAGGRILARYLLDHPAEVAGRRVLDLGSGSGLVALAAAKAGAASVRAVDLSAAAVAAIAANAEANGVAVDAGVADLIGLDPTPDADLVVAGDMFYSAAMSDRVRAWLRRAAAGGTRVLVGDADRGFLPQRLFRPLVRAELAVPVALEETGRVGASVWELRRS